jgi:hypothetical protein
MEMAKRRPEQRGQVDMEAEAPAEDNGHAALRAAPLELGGDDTSLIDLRSARVLLLKKMRDKLRCSRPAGNDGRKEGGNDGSTLDRGLIPYGVELVHRLRQSPGAKLVKKIRAIKDQSFTGLAKLE